MRILSIFNFLMLIGAAFLLFACGDGTGSSATKTTKSGYNYIHHVSNDGAKPEAGQYAYFYYQQRLDDSLLESSRDNDYIAKMQIPTADMLEKTPNPVVDGLLMMSKGDSLTVIMPLDSMPRRPPGWEDKKNMYFDLILTDIKSAEEYAVDAKAEQEKLKAEQAIVQELEKEVADKTQSLLADYKAGKLKDQLKETANGLKYMVHEPGTGKQAEAQNRVKVHYYGVLPDGTMFDNSFRRGQPFEFVLGTGAVIPGWDEGIALLREGAKATLFIPYQLGYGETGSPPTIPPKSELIFYVELKEVK